MRTPFLNAHRGLCGLYPENTIISFRKALELHPDFMEFDVHVTADEEIVILHDDNVDRTTNGTGYVAEMLLDEVRALDAGSWMGSQFAGEKIPTLDEVFSLAEGKVVLHIEIKDSRAVLPVVRKIQDYNLVDKVMVLSFNSQDIVLAKAVCPALCTMLLRWLENPVDFQNLSREVLSSGANWLGINHYVLTAESIRFLHSRGISVLGYTVNEPDRMRELATAGVDAITSDFISILQDTLR